jgi:DNA primase
VAVARILSAVPQPLEDVRDQVRARLNLVDVVQQHVRLRKRGREWIGLCPFHEEKTPSFGVNEQLQSWFCFGCDRGGDIFTFVELREKVPFPEALRILAEMAGVEMPERSGQDQARTRLKRRILELNTLALQYYEYVLHSAPAGEPGRALLERRGVGEETARRFGLGYAPGGANFASFLSRRNRALGEAKAACLVRPDGQDFFQQRLVVPIRDERGQTLAFTGRTVVAGELRKYMNTRETPAYVKGRVLFALDLARGEIEKRAHAVLMEGQFDVIVAHQLGVGNAVASSGTALSEDQLSLLKRFTDEVVLSYDNDPAGRTAAFRAIEMAQAQNVRARVIRLPPEAKDPDEFLRGGGSWEDALKAAATGWEYWLREAIGDRSSVHSADRELVLREIYAVLDRISDPALQDHYRRLAARLADLDEKFVQRPLKAVSPRKEGVPIRADSERNRLGTEGVGKKVSRIVGYLLQVLAVRPEALERVRATLNLADLEGDDRIAYLQMVETLQRGGLEALGREVGNYPPDLEALIRKAWAAPPPGIEDDVVDDVVRRISRTAMARRKRGIIAGLAEAERLGDHEKVAALEVEWRELSGRT